MNGFKPIVNICAIFSLARTSSPLDDKLVLWVAEAQFHDGFVEQRLR